MLSVVNALGAMSRARSRLGSWRRETTRAPVGETSRHRWRIRPPTAGRLAAHAASPRPAGDDGLAGDDPVAPGDEEGALGRDEDVHPGAELHQADPLPGGEDVADRHPGDHAAGHQADDLPEVDRAGGSADLPLDGDVAALVEVGALVPVGREPAPRALDDLGDPAAVRAPG